MFILRAGVMALVLAWVEGAAAQLPAEEEDLALAYGDKDFISIATGNRQLLHKAPAVATVITAEDIAAMGATTVDEALEAVPGMHVSRATFDYNPTYGIRGILTEYNPQVLTLINGIPATSVYLNNRSDILVTLPVENVSRIEVVRGPGSALYGADAFAGTINIITKTAPEIGGLSLGMRAASFQSWDTWLQYGGQHGDIETAAYFKIGSTDGWRRTIGADLQSAIDAARLAPAASLAPGPVNVGHDDIDGQFEAGYGKWRFRAAYWRRENVGTGAGIAYALDPAGKLRNERVTSDLTWSDPAFANQLGLTLQAAYLHHASETTTPLVLFPPGAFFGTFPQGMTGQPSKWERQLRFSATALYTGLSDHRLRLGAGHDNEDIYKVDDPKNFRLSATGLPALVPLPGEPFLRPRSRQVDYAFLQDEWSFARDWVLTAGVRYDRYSDFGGTTNPRLALVWEARNDISAKLLYGSAFRAPSFVEQAAVNNPTATGNPDLQPEKIRTMEGALAWQASSDMRVNLSVFRHQLSDIIAVVPNAGTGSGSTFQNTGKQKGSGGEMEVAWKGGPGLRLSAHYAYQKNIDAATRHDAGYAPHHHIYGRAGWQAVPGWMVHAQVNYVADRKRAFGDNRPQIADYTTVDVTLRTDRPKRGWDFSASIRNLFDADVREPSLQASGITNDLPLPRRSFWLQGRYGL